MRYFDTGVLLKLYVPELRAAEALALVNANPGKPPVNHLHELEMRSALRQKAGRGELTQAECDAVIAQVESEAIAMSPEWPADLLIMDESSGRAMARNLNIRITGTLGVLLKAKRDGQIPSLKSELDRLVQDAGSFVSDRLRNTFLAEAEGVRENNHFDPTLHEVEAHNQCLSFETPKSPGWADIAPCPHSPSCVIFHP